MEDIKRELRQEAEEKHGKIHPPGRMKKLDDCYTVEDNKVLFWFNPEGQTTRVITRDLN